MKCDICGESDEVKQGKYVRNYPPPFGPALRLYEGPLCINCRTCYDCGQEFVADEDEKGVFVRCYCEESR